MIILGVELTGKEAVVCLLREQDGMFYLPECRTNRVQCAQPDRAHDLKYFQQTFAKLAEDYHVDQVVIKARMKKGKFSGGADGFKLEAAIQLIDGLAVSLLSATELKENLKKYPLPIPFAETGLKKFQETAFTTAFAHYAGQHEW